MHRNSVPILLERVWSVLHVLEGLPCVVFMPKALPFNKELHLVIRLCFGPGLVREDLLHLKRLGQPFQDLMALYQFKGDGSQLLEHCLRVFVGNDLVKTKYTASSVTMNLDCQVVGSTQYQEAMRSRHK